MKTRKEAKHIAIAESLSVTKARIEELKKSVKDQHSRRDEYKAIISQQLIGKPLSLSLSPHIFSYLMCT